MPSQRFHAHCQRQSEVPGSISPVTAEDDAVARAASRAMFSSVRVTSLAMCCAAAPGTAGDVAKRRRRCRPRCPGMVSGAAGLFLSATEGQNGIVLAVDLSTVLGDIGIAASSEKSLLSRNDASLDWTELTPSSRQRRKINRALLLKSCLRSCCPPPQAAL